LFYRLVMRRNLAIAGAKSAAALSRRFRLGGGTALPGLVAERIDPRVVAELASQLGRGSVLITGTNGKTTTARLLRSILREAGLRPVSNREGSNLMRGVAAALTEAAGWNGALTAGRNSIGVFEVDEATMPLVARAVKPSVVVFTNLFRDQLDRYGEVEAVAEVWRKAAAEFPAEVTLVINADDPSVSSLRFSARDEVLGYGLDDTTVAGGEIEHAADARWCTRCGAELEYSAAIYAHIGHWRCSSCGNIRIQPDVSCTRVETTTDGLALTIDAKGKLVDANVKLAGAYNAYNALAATAGALALGIEPGKIEAGLAASTAAFGRQERFVIEGREVQVLLAKNPAGANQALRTVIAEPGPLDIAIFLNDDIADGRDISWIWDVDFEMLAGRARSVTVSGRRAWDMALRLKYAGLGAGVEVAGRSENALRRALRGVPEGGRLFVLPTYTAMLEVRDILGKWAGRGRFWEGDGR